MAEIRACTPEDIPAVAELFQKTFRDPGKAAPASLQSYLLDLFLRHPWYEPELAPRVYVTDDGKIGGFIGILPLRMTFRGQPFAPRSRARSWSTSSSRTRWRAPDCCAPS